MNPRIHLVAALLLTLAATSIPAEKRQAAGTFDPQRLTWTRLEFKAKKLFLTARSAVRLRAVPASDAAASWIEPSRGNAVMPDGGTVMEVAIDSAAAGRKSAVNAWFDPLTAAALQRLKVRHGKKAYRKVSRFTDIGTHVSRTAPLDKSQAARPFTEWTKVEDFFYPYPTELGCRIVSEPSVLFYMLSTSSFSPGRAWRQCVFSGKKAIPIAIELAGSELLEVEYAETSKIGTSRRSGEVETWKVAILPLAEGNDFELLGLEGEIEIFLEKESRIPVQVRGKIGGLGRVAVRLTAVELGRP